MPVTGSRNIKRNMGRFVADVRGDKTNKVLTTIMLAAKGHIMLYTPVDTASLINSLDFTVSKGMGTMWFKKGFTKKGFNYAFHLHEDPNWSPRKKRSATSHFMTKGFESPEARSDIMRIIKNGYRL
jgi:hypothetical protein